MHSMQEDEIQLETDQIVEENYHQEVHRHQTRQFEHDFKLAQMEEQFKREQAQIQLKVDSIIDAGAARTTSSGKSANLTHPQTGANDSSQPFKFNILENVAATMEATVEENFQMEKQFKQEHDEIQHEMDKVR
ncbi:hypothetical protein LTR56_005215 [Elasticomyces elasticus]|nr:hypothetical protein LTR56_005215 [Elasticomyces elasticus]KAK3659671.1 hypothetical protein LTR22_008402 [Elasticomyces elasticus]KAK4916894.1 hypothetical protein LTR49_015206 [Elasticomyces elasticus]KAK5747600.1 hypothetical protein LTS12_022337 [Elasticomyces elasticus]